MRFDRLAGHSISAKKAFLSGPNIQTFYAYALEADSVWVRDLGQGDP
jgi:hypothetical protein